MILCKDEIFFVYLSNMERENFNIFNDLISNSYKTKKVPVCFNDWDHAQNLILDKFLKIPLKIKNIEEEILEDLKSYKRFMDAIIWNFLHGEAADVRRFFNDSDIIIQNLKNHNIDAHLDFVRRMKDEFGDCFVLCDLLSNSKIGDVLWLGESGKILPIEIKSGEINKKIIDALKEKEIGNEKKYNELIKNPNVAKQISRMQRQKINYEHETNLYFDGVNELEESLYKILTKDNLSIKTYEKELIYLLEMVEKNNEGFVEIDESLSLCGVKVQYKNSDAFVQNFISQIKGKPLINFFTKDLRDSSIAKPILSFDFDASLKLGLVNSEFFIVQIFYPQVFCEKYSNDKIRFDFHQSKNDFAMVVTDRSTGAYVNWGPGTYNRLFNYLQLPSTIGEISISSLYDFLKL